MYSPPSPRRLCQDSPAEERRVGGGAEEGPGRAVGRAAAEPSRRSSHGKTAERVWPKLDVCLQNGVDEGGLTPRGRKESTAAAIAGVTA